MRRELVTEHMRIAVVGAGPAGLTAAAALAGRVDGEVRVLEREAVAGGIPRHSDHPGYGIRDLRRFLAGPEYARRLVAAAEDAGAVIETRATVTGWAGERALEVTSPRGRRVIEADVVLLATGARERPRPARRIPGDRPDGVYTTGQLQNLVHLHHRPVGRRAVIVGAELVSWSAAMTLREAGCRPVVMTSRHPRSEAYAAFRAVGRPLLGVEVAPRTRLVRIDGKQRVESVLLEDLDSGERRTVACDTVVTTGDWIPDHELARAAGIDLDPGTLGPVVDTSLATSTPGVLAIGNLVHPVDTADVAALDGRHVVDTVLRHLAAGVVQDEGPRIVADGPLRWVAPQIWSPRGPARGKLSLWSDELVRVPVVEIRQDGRVVASRHLPWPCAPGRVFRVPFSLLRDVDPGGGTVHVGVRR